MKRVEAYRVEIPIVAEDKYSKEMDKASKDIKDLEQKVDKTAKAHSDLAKSSQNAAKAQDQVSKSTSKASKSVEGVGKSAQQAERQVRRTSRTFESFGSKVKSLQRAKANIGVTVKDNATRVLGRIQGTWNSFRRNPVTRVTIFAVDRAMRTLQGIRRSVLSIPTMITIGLSYVGVKNLGAATVGAAMDFEGYEVATKHWLGGDEKEANKLVEWMRDYTNLTPFDSPDLFPALSRGIGIAKGDVSEAKDLLMMATDMAAITPGRTVEDAMQAIGNARMGEYSMLSGFNIDMSKEKFDSIGGWSGLKSLLIKEFEGAAEEFSKTARGLLNKTTGYITASLREAGDGILDSMKPRLQSISSWIDNNQDKWMSWRDTVQGAGEQAGEWVFSKLERGFFHLRDNYLENDEFKNLDFQGKIGFISDDVGSFLNKSVKPKLTAWWDETGSDLAVEFGKLIGKGIFEGIKIGLKGGMDLFKGSWSNFFENAKENPFSKETGNSLLGAGAATLGAGYLGKKLIYNPGKSVYKGGKKVTGWLGQGSERQQKRQQRWNESNEKRTQRRLERGERSAARKAERARRYSQTPQAYRPQKNTKNTLGLASGMPFGKGVLRGVGSKVPGLNILFGAMDASSGWKDASNIMGKASDELTLFDKTTASAAKILEGFSFGLIGADKTADFLTGGRSKEGRERLFQQEEAFSFLESGYSSMPVLDGGPPIGEGFSLDFDTSILQRNIDNLAMHLGEASGHVVGAFYPLEGSTAVTSHNIEALNMHLGEASSWVVESFFPMTEASGAIAQNVSALSMNLAEASVYTVESFFPLTTEGALMNQNVSALSTNLAESSVHVVGSFYPLSESGPVLNQNVSALSINLANASGWVNSLYGIQEGAEAVKSALSNLSSRIRRVPTPTMPTMPSMPLSLGSVTPYARGGIATSPHLGLVAEAGKPEAMIPWDGSNRSKALWQQTGEALGMFDGGSSSSGSIDGAGGVAAIAAAGDTFQFGDISISSGADMSAEEIFNKIAPVLYEKIKAALAKRG